VNLSNLRQSKRQLRIGSQYKYVTDAIYEHKEVNQMKYICFFYFFLICIRKLLSLPMNYILF